VGEQITDRREKRASNLASQRAARANHLTRRRYFRGAQAFSLLVSAFCRNRLSFGAEHTPDALSGPAFRAQDRSVASRPQRTTPRNPSSFSQNAKTSRLKACAPQI
jgi:hypothetical protein